MVLKGDIQFGSGNVKLATCHCQRATSHALIKFDTSPFKFTPQHPHVIREVMTD
jgi:hypothetical protein